MEISLTTDEYGRLVGSLTHGAETARVTSSNAADAMADLQAALDDTERDGCGECFWLEGGGDYRWMFRREASHLKLVVLWCSNPVTGWEHIFAGEGDWSQVQPQLRVIASAPQP